MSLLPKLLALIPLVPLGMPAETLSALAPDDGKTPPPPVLPGVTADPHIAAFGGNYYLYPTTDGSDEWVIAYHRFKIPGGNGYNRETCLSPMRFDAKGAILPVDVFETLPATHP